MKRLITNTRFSRHLPGILRVMGMLLLMGLLPVATKAGHEIFNVRAEGTQVSAGLELTVTDDRFNTMSASGDWQSQFHNQQVTNRVTLAIDPYGQNFMGEAFTVTAMVEIIYDRWDAATNSFVNSVRQQELSIEYTLSGPYKNKSTAFIKNGGHRMRVRVLDYFTSPGNLGFVPNVELVAEIDVERYYAFDVQDIPNTTTLQLDDSRLASRNELLATWDVFPGAEEYDLEWIWLNNIGSDGNPLQPDEIKVDYEQFRLNSTRITTSKNYYAIPMIYEPGYIVVRYRPIGRNPETNYKEVFPGQWSRDIHRDCPFATNFLVCWPTNHKYLFAGFSKNMNWQAAVDYIEEGKNKPKVDYFDATLTPRQQQVRINSNDMTLVGESVYDREGRAVISVLPVPADQMSLSYINHFNQNASGVSYNFLDFQGGTENCPATQPMEAAESGAANYYSPANPDKSGHQAYLPDAKGYPFVQSAFTLDPLGRVKAQSLPGETHKLGNGRETKYYYGKPSQQELDRLFGHDVGKAINYRRNMMVDPNKQVHITYLDGQNRIIASALAGDTPEGLDELDQSPERNMSIDVMDNQLDDPVSQDGKSKTFSYSHLVTKEGQQTFKYDITSDQFQTECVLPDNDQEHCYNCVVDVSYTILNECGDQLLDGFDDTGSTMMTIGTFSPDCVDPVGSASDEETLQLNVGSYTISRTVSINEEALTKYTQDYLDSLKNTCLLTLQDFMDDAMDDVDISVCATTCESCKEEIGVYDDWTINPYNEDFNPDCSVCLTEEEYDEYLGTCDALCNEEAIDCSNMIKMMKADMKPHGQYGGIASNPEPVIDEDGNVRSNIEASTFDPTVHPLSIYNPENRLPLGLGGVPSWKNPVHFQKSSNANHYFTKDGEIATVQIVVIGFDEDDPDQPILTLDVDPDFIPADLEPGDIFYVEPHRLSDVQQFLSSLVWQPSFDESLVIHHPEYPYYEQCLIDMPSHTWDREMLNIQTIDSMLVTYGDLGQKPDFLGVDPTSSLDPYFLEDATINPRFALWEYNLMKYRMQNYLFDDDLGPIDIWTAVHLTVNCPYYNASTTSCPDCFDTFDGINTDEEWLTFKSFYRTTKQSLQSYKTRVDMIKATNYNGCIGHEDFDPDDLNIWDPIIRDFLWWSWVNSQFLNPFQTCNFADYKLYKDKTQRAPGARDMMGVDKSDFNCYEEVVVGDYDADGNITNISIPASDELIVTACPESAQDILDEQKMKVDHIFFESCGQCPLARDIQLLLNDIATEIVDQDGNVTRPSRLVLGMGDVVPEIDPVNPSFYLSCYPSFSDYASFTPDLEQGINLAGTESVGWVQESVTSKQLDVAIKRIGGSEECNLTLKMADDSPYNLGDVHSVCCLYFTDAPQLLPLQSGRNFTIEGKVNVPSPENGDPVIEKVYMEGVSCINIQDCPMPPVCEMNPSSETLETLFDALAKDGVFESGGSPIDIYTESESGDDSFEPYVSIIRGTLDNDVLLDNGDWTWSSTVTSNQLSATIASSSGASVGISFLVPSGTSIDFSNVIAIQNIKPDVVTDEDNANKMFTINVLVENPDGTRESMKVWGVINGAYEISSCRPVAAPDDEPSLN